MSRNSEPSRRPSGDKKSVRRSLDALASQLAAALRGAKIRHSAGSDDGKEDLSDEEEVCKNVSAAAHVPETAARATRVSCVRKSDARSPRSSRDRPVGPAPPPPPRLSLVARQAPAARSPSLPPDASPLAGGERRSSLASSSTQSRERLASSPVPSCNASASHAAGDANASGSSASIPLGAALDNADAPLLPVTKHTPQETDDMKHGDYDTSTLDLVYSNAAAFSADQDADEDYVNTTTLQEYRHVAISRAKSATAAQQDLVRRQEEEIAAGRKRRPQPPPAYIKPPLTRSVEDDWNSDDVNSDGCEDPVEEAETAETPSATPAQRRSRNVKTNRRVAAADKARVTVNVSDPDASTKALRVPKTSIHERRQAAAPLQMLLLGVSSRPENRTSACTLPESSPLATSPRSSSPRRDAPLPGKVVGAYLACAENELSLTVGEILDVTAYPRDAEWWSGRIGRGREGRFPAACVQLQTRVKKSKKGEPNTRTVGGAESSTFVFLPAAGQ